jgi:F0F1-type ATP synthase delta subunit
MKPLEFASALYRAVRGKGQKEVAAGVERLTAALKARGAVRLLPEILAELPKAIDEAEAAHEIDAKTLAGIVTAVGADAATADVRHVIRPELIGGARVRKHGVTIDASVRGRLDRIKQALARRTS